MAHCKASRNGCAGIASCVCDCGRCFDADETAGEHVTTDECRSYGCADCVEQDEREVTRG